MCQCYDIKLAIVATLIACFVHNVYQWVNPYTVVAMDTSERIHLISAKTDAEVEVELIFIRQLSMS